MHVIFETQTLSRCFRLFQTDSFYSEYVKLFIKWTQGQSDFVYDKDAYGWNWFRLRCCGCESLISRWLMQNWGRRCGRSQSCFPWTRLPLMRKFQWFPWYPILLKPCIAQLPHCTRVSVVAQENVSSSKFMSCFQVMQGQEFAYGL